MQNNGQLDYNFPQNPTTDLREEIWGRTGFTTIGCDITRIEADYKVDGQQRVGLTLAGDVTLLRCVGTSIPSWWKVITWRLERAAGESWRLEATNVTDLGEFSYFYCLATSWNPFDFDLAVTWLGAPCFVQVVYIELNF